MKAEKATRREIVFLLIVTAAALMLIFGAALVGFAPVWQNDSQIDGTVLDLEECVRVNLNTADLHALCCLPGVGSARAMAILEYRAQYGPFTYPAELCDVPGIDLRMIVDWGNMVYTTEQNAEGS